MARTTICVLVIMMGIVFMIDVLDDALARQEEKKQIALESRDRTHRDILMEAGNGNRSK